VTEHALSFAAGGRLTGILTEPDTDRCRPGAPLVLSSNVGINHHVGPYRFFVDLSRALARRGFASLRFDLSGLGNSGARKDTLGDLQRAVDDHVEAMNFLATRGYRRFVPVGFCSSVDAAHGIALRDERVVGVCFIEGYTFRTRGFFLRYPLRLFDRARWRRVLSRKMPPILRDLPGLRRLGRFATAFAGQDQVFLREYPEPADLRRDYEALIARGTHQLFIYTGDDNYNHQGQFLEFTGLTSLGPTMKIVHLPEADHTLFRVADRDHAIALVCDWMEVTAVASYGPR